MAKSVPTKVETMIRAKMMAISFMVADLGWNSVLTSTSLVFSGADSLGLLGLMMIPISEFKGSPEDLRKALKQVVLALKMMHEK